MLGGPSDSSGSRPSGTGRTRPGRHRGATAAAGLWHADVAWMDGVRRPVRSVLPGRLREVEFHHVDLDAGHTPAHWDPEFVDGELAGAAATLSGRPGMPDVTLVATDRAGPASS